MALTSGATARRTGDGGPNVLRQSAAQAGIGTPPKVSDKVLNTSGYKGCNPLNVKVFGNKWKGLIGQDERGHAIFARPEDGIRAGVKVIQTYANKYGLNTIESILSRFAAADSLTMGSYVDNVSHATGYGSNERLNLKDPEVLKKVVTAMMKQEIGDVPYLSERLLQVSRALWVKKTLTTSPTSTTRNLQTKRKHSIRHGLRRSAMSVMFMTMTLEAPGKRAPLKLRTVTFLTRLRNRIITHSPLKVSMPTGREILAAAG